PVEAVRKLLAARVPANRITVSSDGNASVPRVRPDGSLEAFSYQLGQLGMIRDLVSDGVVDTATALSFVTSNPARTLALEPVGTLAVGAPSDIIVLEKDFTVRHVIAGGQLVVRDRVAVTSSPFRDPR